MVNILWHIIPTSFSLACLVLWLYDCETDLKLHSMWYLKKSLKVLKLTWWTFSSLVRQVTVRKVFSDLRDYLNESGHIIKLYNPSVLTVSAHMCYYFQEYLPSTCWARTLEDWTSAPRPTWHPLDHQPIPWWQAMPWRWACQPPWQQICPLQWPRVPWGWGEFLQTKAWWEWTWAWIWAWPLQWWWVAWLAWEFQEWGWASHTPSAQPWFHPNKMPSLILAVLGNEGVKISVYECVCESVRERETEWECEYACLTLWE